MGQPVKLVVLGSFDQASCTTDSGEGGVACVVPVVVLVVCCNKQCKIPTKYKTTRTGAEEYRPQIETWREAGVFNFLAPRHGTARRRRRLQYSGPVISLQCWRHIQLVSIQALAGLLHR